MLFINKIIFFTLFLLIFIDLQNVGVISAAPCTLHGRFVQEELIVDHIVKKFAAFVITRKSIYRLTRMYRAKINPA